VYHGHGTDTDIIVASAKAYLAALNRLLATKENEAATSTSRSPKRRVSTQTSAKPGRVTA
jgi:2-isopropylmalate synthase